MHILITGAGGFIGSHLVESQLARGHTVCALDISINRIDHLQSEDRLTIVQGSITDRSLLAKILEGVDIVYHLASAHLDVSLSDEIYYEVNVNATQMLLELALAEGVKRVVHCSSVGVIGDVEDPPADETTVCSPTNVYERTKLEGEKVAVDFARNNRLPVVIVRPAWVYGPRCPRTEKLIRTVGKGRFVIFGRAGNWRHPIFIKDMVHGLEQAAECEVVDEDPVYILASDRPVKISELLNTIAIVQSVNPPFLKFPMWLGKLGGYTVQFLFGLIGKHPPFSRRTIDFYLKNNAYRIDKAKAGLGFHPQYELEDGMRETVAYLTDGAQ